MNAVRTLFLVVASVATTAAFTQPPQKSEPNQQVPATPQANAGSQNATAAATTMPPAGESNATLQGRIQQALQSASGLNASHISVNVTDNSIELSGTVSSGEEKRMAQRIAQSFDGNRKFHDTLMVTGQAPTTANTGTHEGDRASTPKER